MSVNVILSLPIALAFWFGIALLGHPSLKTSIAFLLVLASLIPVESFLGLMMGVGFPDFSETIRSRFITIPGMLLGMLLGVAAAGAILAPYGFYLFFKAPQLSGDIYFLVVSLASLTLATLISAITYRFCIAKTKKLFGELPI